MFLFRVCRCSVYALAVAAISVTGSAQSNSSPPGASSSSIDKAPVSVGIFVDSSVERWGGAAMVRRAVMTFLRSLREDDEYALFTATDNFHLDQEFTGDAELADPAIKRMKLGGTSKLYDCLVAAIRYMGAEVGNDRKALLVLSSGEDAGSRAGLSGAITAAQQAGVPVFVIAIPAGTWRAYADLSQLAAQTSGTALMPAKKSELPEVSEAVARRLMGPPLAAAHHSHRKPLSAYSELIVRSIPVAKTAETADFRPGDNILLAKLLVSRLEAKRTFPEVVDATDSSGDDVRGPVEGTAPHTKLELLATIVGFKRGSHLKRGTAGVLGSGVARVRVQFVLRDAATRKPVLSFVKEGSGSSGLLGGSNEDNQTQAMLRLVNASVTALKHNR